MQTTCQKLGAAGYLRSNKHFESAYINHINIIPQQN